MTKYVLSKADNTKVEDNDLITPRAVIKYYLDGEEVEGNVDVKLSRYALLERNSTNLIWVTELCVAFLNNNEASNKFLHALIKARSIKKEYWMNNISSHQLIMTEEYTDLKLPAIEPTRWNDKDTIAFSTSVRFLSPKVTTRDMYGKDFMADVDMAGYHD